jgi:hypothetical protein
MLVFSKLFRIYSLVFFAIFLFQIGVKMAPSQVPQQAESSSVAQPISVLIRTDREKYSTGDTVKLDVSLQNTSDATVYVDRRMFWGGFAGSRKLEISDEQGKPVPSHVLHDAMMPPPKGGHINPRPARQRVFLRDLARSSREGQLPKTRTILASIHIQELASQGVCCTAVARPARALGGVARDRISAGMG